VKVRKKPVVVEAVRFTGDNWAEMHAFTGHHMSSGGEWPIDTFNPIGTYTMSDDPKITAEVWDKLHSTWVGVKDGQWIIQGVQGEFYPCDAEVFADSYEEVS
jgi:hypothetical protein